MELQAGLLVVRKRWRLILAVLLVAIGSSAVVILVSVPQYEATTQLFVSTQGGVASTDLLQGSNFSQQRVKSYAEIATSPKVLQPVIDELNLGISADNLAKQVNADAPLDTVLINISVRTSSAKRSEAIANAIATSFGETVTALEKPSDNGASPVRVSVVKKADLPANAVSPNIKLDLSTGIVVGLLLGVVAALMREKIDTSVKGEADLRKVTEAAVLGGIGYDPDAPTHPLIVQTDPHGMRAEAFRQLRTNLQFVDVTSHPRCVVITSSIPGEGKSTTTANLAITLAAAGSRVVLVEGDLRRPKIADYMGIEGGAGLTTVLIGQAELEHVLQPWGSGNLHVLPAGAVPPNPSELLGSQAMDTLLRKLESHFDFVIIDAPPLLPVTDAAVLAKLAGGAIVVVRSNKISRDQLNKAMENLASVGARVLGVVLNFLPTKGPDAYGYGYGYAGEYRPEVAKPVAAATSRRHAPERESATQR